MWVTPHFGLSIALYGMCLYMGITCRMRDAQRAEATHAVRMRRSQN